MNNRTLAPAIMVSLAFLPLVACKSGAPPDTRPAASSSASSAMPLAHDPAHPPIDCPLRKAGIEPHNLKPFEDVEKYIAFLERPDRATWQKPDALVSSLALTGNETVADVGAGSGYFTFRFARALPHGHVIATDIEPQMVRHIHHKATLDGFSNVEVVIGAPDDPKLPSGVGVAFVCDVLHHVQDRQGWLSKIFAELPSPARLIVVEFREGDLPEGPPASMKLPREQVVALATAVGFTKTGDDSALLPYQYVLSFRKP